MGGIAGQINKTKMENCISNPTSAISIGDDVGNISGNTYSGCEVNYCYYLTYDSSEEKYCGNTTVTPENCNTFRVMNTEYQVYNAGNSLTGTYSADTDLCDIMNDWVNYKNTISPGYLNWQYESSRMEFVD